MTMGIQRLIWQVEAVADAFHRAVYVDRDAAAALPLLAEDCLLLNLPMQTGSAASGSPEGYLADDVVPHLPPDLAFRRVTRTSDQRQVVDEAVVAFTHDREVPWLLPGVPASGARIEVLAISILAFRHSTSMGTVTSRIASHRTLWDHAGLVS